MKLKFYIGESTKFAASTFSFVAEVLKSMNSFVRNHKELNVKISKI